MRFEEVMCSLKKEDLEKICFVENGICKVGFPCSSLDKYVVLFENKKYLMLYMDMQKIKKMQ